MQKRPVPTFVTLHHLCRVPFFITLLKDVQHASPAGSVRDGVCCERGRLPSKNAGAPARQRGASRRWTMTIPDRPAGPDVQRCPSCESTAVLSASVEGGKVWLVCRRCDLRWSIPDRRTESATRYDGPERRGRLFSM